MIKTVRNPFAKTGKPFEISLAKVTHWIGLRNPLQYLYITYQIWYVVVPTIIAIFTICVPLRYASVLIDIGFRCVKGNFKGLHFKRHFCDIDECILSFTTLFKFNVAHYVSFLNEAMVKATLVKKAHN